MSVNRSQVNGGRTLAELLSEVQSLALPRKLEIVRAVAEQVGALHAAGTIHRAITLDSIQLEDLSRPVLAVTLSGMPVTLDRDTKDLLPELSRLASRGIPGEIAAARRQFREAGITLDPRQIDLCQLGGLVCRLLTGESARAYLRSPSVKGKTAAELRPVIERLLGCEGRERFADVRAFLDALDEVNARGDTTPSSASLPGKSGDTSPGGGKPASSRPAVEAGQLSQGPLPFSRLGHYEIVDRIGHGGMGDVYLGFERELDRKLAIKVLPDELARSHDFIRRFKSEATAAAKLIHPNIVPIYSIGHDQGHHFYVMPYIAGESLAGLLDRRQRLSPDEALPIVEQVLSGLAAAHKQGMVHRDIKPANILLDHGDRHAMLADFGLVKSLDSSKSGQTATGVVMGTCDYISPEQGRGQAVDARSDLYSMGVLLFRMLSGRLPFTGDSPTAVIFQHVYEPPPALTPIAPDVPEALGAVVARLMAKSPTDRYQNVESLLEDLHRAQPALPRLRDAEVNRSHPSPDAQSPASQRQATQIVPTPASGWWEHVLGQARSLYRRYAPEVVQRMHNTRQQIDGAVAAHARRKRDLERLLAEADGVLRELQKEATAQRQAAELARQRAASAGDEKSAQKAQDAERKSVEEANGLEGQVAAQQEQIESIRVRLAQVSARLQELQNRRDILNARLNAAERRQQGAGRRRAAGRRLLVSAVAVVMAAIVGGPAWQKYHDAPKTSASPPANADLEDELAAMFLDSLPVPDANVIYLDDLSELDFGVHVGTLGKHGSTGFPAPDVQKCRLDGRVLIHALSMHPPDQGASYALYELGGKYDVFRGTAVLNTAVPEDGLENAKRHKWNGQATSPLTFRLVGDGKPLWTSRPLQKHGVDWEEVELSIAGVNQLRLEVQCAGPANFAWAFWGDPCVRPVAGASSPPEDSADGRTADKTVTTQSRASGPRANLLRFYDVKLHEHIYTYGDIEAMNWRQRPEMERETVVGQVALSPEPDTTPLFRAIRRDGHHYYYLIRPTEARQMELEDFTCFVWTKPGDGRIAVHGCTLPDMTDLLLDTDPKKVTDFSDNTLKGIGQKRKNMPRYFYVYPADPAGPPPVAAVKADAASAQSPPAAQPARVDASAAAVPQNLVRNLPEIASDICVGGGGRYMIVHLPKMRKLAVFDVSEAAIVRFIPLAEDNVVYAAGLDKLVVCLPKKGVLERYNLFTGAKELTQPEPNASGESAVLMGAASRGPLVANRVFLNLSTLKPLGINTLSGTPAPWSPVSADGTVFGAWKSNQSPTETTTFVVRGKELVRYNEGGAGHVVPGPDGQAVYTSDGVCTSQLKAWRGGPSKPGYCIPAVEGSFFLSLIPADGSSGGRMALYLLDHEQPLVKDLGIAHGIHFDNWDRTTFGPWKRIFLIPQAKRIVIFPEAQNRLELFHFDLEDALKNFASYAGDLRVTSQPPTTARRGKAVRYQIVAKSTAESLNYQLASGPLGLQMAPSGLVTWRVPDDAPEGAASAIIGIRDDAGQEVFHVIRLEIAE